MKSSAKGSPFFFTLAVTVLFGGCGGSRPADSKGSRGERFLVVASNFPLYTCTERIAGDLAEVRFLSPPDIDPAFWQPSPESIAILQAADLVVLNGATYESWIDRVSLSPRRILDTSAGFSTRLLAAADDITHQHGPGGEHSHGAVAFTTWLDLSLAAEQADAIRAKLSRLWPDRDELLQARTEELTSELAVLDQGFLAWGESLTDQPLLGSHPVYQYFAARYRLNLVSVHWEPDEMPDPETWRELEALLADHPARWMIWEGEPLAETVARLEALGLSSVVIDPGGNRPNAGTFLELMADNLERARGMLD